MTAHAGAHSPQVRSDRHPDRARLGLDERGFLRTNRHPPVAITPSADRLRSDLRARSYCNGGDPGIGAPNGLAGPLELRVYRPASMASSVLTEITSIVDNVARKRSISASRCLALRAR